MNIGTKQVTNKTKIELTVSPLAMLSLSNVTSHVPDLAPVVDRLLEKISEGNALAFIERSEALLDDDLVEGFSKGSLFDNVRVIRRGPVLISTIIVADDDEDIAHVMVIDAGVLT